MNTSESIINLIPALLNAQKEITFAAKDAENPHYKSKYANLESVIEAIKKPLNDNGIVFVQAFEVSQPGYLCLNTRLMHISGEWIEDFLQLPLQKADAQGYGSAATYARRYALSAITGLFQADDDGQEAVKPAPLTKDQVQAIDAANDIIHYFSAGDFDECYRVFDDEKDTEIRLKIWSELQPHSKIRSTLKKMASEKSQQSKEI